METKINAVVGKEPSLENADSSVSSSTSSPSCSQIHSTTTDYSSYRCSALLLVGMRALLCRPTPRDLGGRGLGNCARLQGPNATRPRTGW
eukprot:scaffold13251_cov77-Skeletonema_dohrnii-CCMP3373.AAC.1